MLTEHDVFQVRAQLVELAAASSELGDPAHDFTVDGIFTKGHLTKHLENQLAGVLDQLSALLVLLKGHAFISHGCSFLIISTVNAGSPS
jgi:hypothetical protein